MVMKSEMKGDQKMYQAKSAENQVWKNIEMRSEMKRRRGSKMYQAKSVENQV